MSDEIFWEDNFIFGHSGNGASPQYHFFEVDQDLSKEIGFSWPVQITQRVKDFLTPSKQAAKEGERYETRLRKILELSYNAIKAANARKKAAPIDIEAAFPNGANRFSFARLLIKPDITDNFSIRIILSNEH